MWIMTNYKYYVLYVCLIIPQNITKYENDESLLNDMENVTTQNVYEYINYMITYLGNKTQNSHVYKYAYIYKRSVPWNIIIVLCFSK